VDHQETSILELDADDLQGDPIRIITEKNDTSVPFVCRASGSILLKGEDTAFNDVT
jgi:hypothetical protein